MSIQEIVNKNYKDFIRCYEDYEKSFSFKIKNKSEILLSALAKLFAETTELEQKCDDKTVPNQEEKLPDFGKERWLKTIDFYFKYPKFAHPYYLSELFSKNKEAFAFAGKREGRFYYVNAPKLFYHLYKNGGSVMKNRSKEILTKLGII